MNTVYTQKYLKGLTNNELDNLYKEKTTTQKKICFEWYGVWFYTEPR